MGRPRKPSEVKIVSGTAQKCRMNPNEPRPERGVPPQPPGLPPKAAECWDKAAAVLDGMGVLTQADEIALAALCTAISDEHAARESLARTVMMEDAEGNPITVAEGGSQTYLTVGKSGPMIRLRPEVAAIAEANRRVSMWLAKFGLTPADRSRVGAAELEKENPFAGL